MRRPEEQLRWVAGVLAGKCEKRETGRRLKRDVHWLTHSTSFAVKHSRRGTRGQLVGGAVAGQVADSKKA
jgi:hypothetical protein